MEVRGGEGGMGKQVTWGYISPVITHVLVDRSRAAIEVTGDQIVAAIREHSDMGQGDKDKGSSNVIVALSKKVHGAGLTEEHGTRIGVS